MDAITPPPGHLKCSRCRLFKPVAEFRPRPDTKRSYRYLCKPCQRLAERERRERNREQHLVKERNWRQKNKARRQLLKRRRLREFRRWLDEQKNSPCADCGMRFPPCVMDFDHRLGTEKCFGVGHGYNTSREAVIAEIAKCDLVCANCHRIRTRDRRQYYHTEHVLDAAGL